MIAAYTYDAETICLDCTFEKFVRLAVALEGQQAYHYSTEEVLEAVAYARGINRDDEHSFDSSAFPKVVFAEQLGGVEGIEYCDECAAEL